MQQTLSRLGVLRAITAFDTTMVYPLNHRVSVISTIYCQYGIDKMHNMHYRDRTYNVTEIILTLLPISLKAIVQYYWFVIQ